MPVPVSLEPIASHLATASAASVSASSRRPSRVRAWARLATFRAAKGAKATRSDSRPAISVSASASSYAASSRWREARFAWMRISWTRSPARSA